MTKRASTAANVTPTSPPADPDSAPAPVPTEAEARARLAGFRTTIGRMTQEEFDALVAIAGPAEDEMAGH